jgi:hypothetical protein
VEQCADDAPVGASGASACAPHGKKVDLTAGGSSNDGAEDVVITAGGGPSTAADVGKSIVHTMAALSPPPTPPPTMARPRSAAVVLRLTKTTPQGSMLPSPVVHLKDVNRDRGLALMQDLTPALPPTWHTFHSVHWPLVHNVPLYLFLPGAVGDTAERLWCTEWRGGGGLWADFGTGRRSHLRAWVKRT